SLANINKPSRTALKRKKTTTITTKGQRERKPPSTASSNANLSTTNEDEVVGNSEPPASKYLTASVIELVLTTKVPLIRNLPGFLQNSKKKKNYLPTLKQRVSELEKHVLICQNLIKELTSMHSTLANSTNTLQSLDSQILANNRGVDNVIQLTHSDSLNQSSSSSTRIPLSNITGKANQQKTPKKTTPKKP
ncbi:hypothetical protein HK098_008398, partial [Nowakowskiella sp. JEL0407]